MLKDYLQLFRIPNTFTVPPDILGGYFVTTISDVNLINYCDILMLVFSSVFLYIGGLVTNDLFDIDRDMVERPNRPLPSRKIKKSTACSLAIFLFGLGILLSSFLSITSTIISIFLVLMILSYNYRLKNGISRPFLMGGIRSLNIVYGASSNTNYFDFIAGTNVTIQMYTPLACLTILTLAVFIHIFTLTFLSARETHNEFGNPNKKRLSLKMVYAYYLSLFIVILFLGLNYLPYKIHFTILIGLFLLCVNLLFFSILWKKKYGYADIQFLVKNMIVLLILLDSSFVVGSVGVYFGIISLGLIIPCVLMGKKVKMT